jgi:hypothetical protein
MSVAQDTFSNFQGGLQSPPRNSFAITPSDTAELPFVTRSIYVGGTGDLTVRLAGDAGQLLIKAVPAGRTPPLRVRQVYVTGTTATGLVGFY